MEVRISQYGWDAYWQKLTASFVAGVGPDVFTDHLTRYPEYAQKGLLLDLNTIPVTKKVTNDQFHQGLAELWYGQNGKRYGMPKDFDTVAVFYNKKVIEDANLTEDDLSAMTWNPKDGGSFEKVIAHLSVDSKGVRGDEKGFDPDHVAVYGYASNGSGGFNGQTAWSWLPASMGWQPTNKDVWGTKYNFDDPRLAQSLSWLYGLVDKGFMAPFEEVGTSPNPPQALGSGKAALSVNGSWMIRTYSQLKGIDLGIASLPAGPVGHPVSMYNGLADSISSQTTHPDEAARFVAFLGSDKCQTLIGDQGVVFPAREAGTKAAKKAFAQDGIDVEPFLHLVDENYTIYFPVTRNYGKLEAFMNPIMDELYIGSRDVATLKTVNNEINSILDASA